MNNRFFDIDNNVFLNSLYLTSLMRSGNVPCLIQKLLIELYLIKNPRLFVQICKEVGIVVDTTNFHDFQLDNFQSEMCRYSFRIHTEGFFEALSYLYSKGILEYKNNYILKGNMFDYIDFEVIPKKIRLSADYVHGLVSERNYLDIKRVANFVEESYYE